jgi:serine/threonine protein kinase
MNSEDQPTIRTAPPNGSRPVSVGWQAPSVEEMQAMLPQYEVIDILGRGGMGAVYKARQKSLKRLVAIKILPLGMADDEMKFVERFQNEAQTMAAMNHPAIVSVYDFGETANGLLYFIMEYVDGSDVHKLIQASGKLSGEYALAITAHVCDALSYAHKRGVIHRDIKPANILIDQEGHIKVADFGLAKMDDPSQTSGLTKTNMAMGTPDYVAPEVLVTGMVADHRADLYAVGVMLYQMLTGEVPRGMFKLPSQKGIGSDPRFDEIICKAMEQDREERYQSAMDVRHALDVILTTPQPKDDGTGIVSASQIPQKPVAKQPRPPGERSQAPAQNAVAAPKAKAPPKKQSPATLWLSIGGIVAVLGVTGFLVLGDKPKPQAIATNETASATSPSAKPPIKALENPNPAATAIPASAQGKEIDLLPLVDVKRDAVAGDWSRKGDSISVGTPPGVTVLELPYQPPEEYDFEMEFTPDGPGSNVNQYVSAGGHSFAWKMNAHSKTPPLYGFELLDGKFCKDTDEASTTSDVALVQGQRYHSTVQVRRGSLRALLDGKLVVNWVGDFKRLSMEAIAKLRDDGHIGIGSWKRAVTFHKITVREITGAGKMDGGGSLSSSKAGGFENWMDRLTTTKWSPTWSLKDGILSTLDRLAYQEIAEGRDVALRVKARRSASASSGNLMLQPSLRLGPVAGKPQRRASYQFQGYVPGGSCSVVYLEEDIGTRANQSPPEYLLRNFKLPSSLLGKSEIEWEFRAIGDEMSIWADGQFVTSFHDSRVPSGKMRLAVSPGIEITAVQTSADFRPTDEGGTGTGKVDAPQAAASPANYPPGTEKIDWLKSAEWKAPWSLESGRLKSTTTGKTRYFGVGRDATVHMRFHEAAAPESKDPPLQISFRGGPSEGAADRTVGYLLQIYPKQKHVQLLFMPKDTRANVDVPEFLWKDQPFPPSALSNGDMDLELRVIGQDLSLWSGSKQIAAIRDGRAQSGAWGLSGSPGVEITALQTSGITPNPGTISPPQAGNAPPQISNWQDVTDASREKAKSIPGMIVDPQGIRWEGTGYKMRLPLPQVGLRDQAISVRYTGQAQVDLRISPGGFVYVLAQTKQTIFQGQPTGVTEPVKLATTQPHPADFDPERPHELLLTMVGKRVRVWLDGRFVSEGNVDAYPEGESGLMVMRNSVVHQIKVADLKADPTATPPAQWQPIFNKSADFEGDLRGVEFRDGATFLKARSVHAPAEPLLAAIRSTMRYLEVDRTGSLSLRSTEPSKYGDEDFACTVFIAPMGANLVIKMRDRSAGVGNGKMARYDFPLSPALKEGDLFTFELRAEGKEITAIINGREVGTVTDTWTGAPRRFGITPSNTDMTEFRDVAVKPESPWTDWLGPKLAAGDFATNGWVRSSNGVTTEREISGVRLLPPGTKNAAVRVTYVLQDSEGLMLNARERMEGKVRLAYCAIDKVTRLHLDRLKPDGRNAALQHVILPEEAGRMAERTLELRIIGNQIKATLNGTFAGTATDDTLSEGEWTLVFLKGVLVKKVEVQPLDALP